MSKRIILSLVFLLFITINTKAQHFVWAKGFGDLNFDDIGYAVALDAANNVYSTGTFKDTADFDPGTGTYTLIANALEDVYVSKLDSTGHFIWAKQFAGLAKEYGYAITTDLAGNVYIAGGFYGKCDFDPGLNLQQLTPQGEDAYVCKLDAAGNFMWVAQLGGASNDEALGIKTDAAGNVYVVGHFGGTCDFDPGANTALKTAVGATDVFICKLNSSGVFQQVWTVGGTGNDNATGICLDASGTMYVCGYFQATCDFDPGVGVNNVAVNGGAGDRDVFVMKLKSNGSLAWAKNFGGVTADYGLGVAVDAARNVLSTGWFMGTADFDPNAGISNLNAHGGAADNDVFISKLDSNGNYMWAKGLGGIGVDAGYGIVTDATGNVYATGWFQDSVDFDPGIGTNPIWSNGDFDCYLTKFDANGNFVWAATMGGATDDGAYGIAIDPVGNVYSTGEFSNTADFDPDPAHSYPVSTIAHLDAYVNKLSACYYPYDTALVVFPDTICSGSSTTLTIGGYLNAATLWHIYTGGCGATAVGTTASSSINLTPNSTTTYFVRAEGGCPIPGNCDTVRVNVTPSVMPSVQIIASTDSICAGDNITFLSTINNGGTSPSYAWFINQQAIAQTTSGFTQGAWTNSDTVTCQLTSNLGCVTAATVSSNAIVITVTTVNATVTANANQLSTGTVGNSYQWIDCNSHQAITGATSNIYYPTHSGNFAVVVSRNGCMDTSDCILFNYIGIESLMESPWTIYPNPGTNQLHFNLNVKAVVEVQNALGQLIYRSILEPSNNQSINTTAWSSGLYLVKIQTATHTRLMKWEKE